MSVPNFSRPNSPRVTARFVHELRNTRILVVVCPYCRKPHQHGWPWSDGEGDPGHRLAHCNKRPGAGYYIVAGDAR